MSKTIQNIFHANANHPACIKITDFNKRNPLHEGSKFNQAEALNYVKRIQRTIFDNQNLPNL